MMAWRGRLIGVAGVWLAMLCGTCAVGFAAAAKTPDVWVGTWAAAPVAAANSDGRVGSSDVTLREIVHVSRGGPYTRIVLTNEFGTEPLTIGAVHVALSAGGSSISLVSANAVTFGGNASVTIPPGALAVSDGFALALPPLTDVTVSLFVPAQKISTVSRHGAAYQTNFVADGNVVGKARLDGAREFANWDFVKGIDVRVPGTGAGAIVMFGDSITDGALSTKNANARWPDVLAQRLQKDRKTRELGVLNEGIGGNRILHDGTAANALARFDRDVIAQAGVKYVVVMEGINDIGHAFDPVKTYDVVSAEDLIAGMKQMAERAHLHGIKIIGATLTPYVGAKYASPAGEAARQTLNAWIRSSPMLDGVIDFDKITQDPGKPGTFLPAFDSGDHLHPKDAGYAAMGNGVGLKLFEGKK